MGGGVDSVSCEGVALRVRLCFEGGGLDSCPQMTSHWGRACVRVRRVARHEECRDRARAETESARVAPRGHISGAIRRQRAVVCDLLDSRAMLKSGDVCV